MTGSTVTASQPPCPPHSSLTVADQEQGDGLERTFPFPPLLFLSPSGAPPGRSPPAPTALLSAAPARRSPQRLLAVAHAAGGGPRRPRGVGAGPESACPPPATVLQNHVAPSQTGIFLTKFNSHKGHNYQDLVNTNFWNKTCTFLL